MTRTKFVLLVATAIAVVLWALRFLPGGVLPGAMSDFFGGMAVGLAIATAVTWLAEPTPPN